MVRRLLIMCAAGVLLGSAFILSPQTTFACGGWGYCCPCVCYPCWIPCWQPCCVFHVSGDPVPIDGSYPTLVRRVRVGEGVIAQFDVHSGINPAPIDPPQIEVVQTDGSGQMLYYGWGVPCVLHPGLPGGSIRYSIFLCGYSIGDCYVEARLKYTDGSIHTAKYHFRIYDIYGR
jgi:hypothetical protein